MLRATLACGACLGILAVLVAPAVAVTDDDVWKAIDKAKEYIVSRQLAGGLWPEEKLPEGAGEVGTSETVFFTLAYMGEHPNRDYMGKALDAILKRSLDTTYAVSMRAMGLAYIRNKLGRPTKMYEEVNKALHYEALWLVQAQGSHGGWGPKPLGGRDGPCDFANTQVAIHALREATEAGIEIPPGVWQRTQQLYFSRQQPDGGWNSGDPSNKDIGAGGPSSGSMTAAAIASVFITWDQLEKGTACPCRGGDAAKASGELVRRTDLAMAWLSKEFRIDKSAKGPGSMAGTDCYWLYAAEQAALASGTKYFGSHDWYKEGAERLVKTQAADGSWGNLPNTCLGVLFLYTGRGPLFINKLWFEGDWNSHPRDLARAIPVLGAYY
jgi:predicted secreted Zn-dependent protease